MRRETIVVIGALVWVSLMSIALIMEFAGLKHSDTVLYIASTEAVMLSTYVLYQLLKPIK
jgi:hypothetical protein